MVDVLGGASGVREGGVDFLFKTTTLQTLDVQHMRHNKKQQENNLFFLHLTLDCEMVHRSQLCITMTLKLFKKKIKKKEVLNNS